MSLFSLLLTGCRERQMYLINVKVLLIFVVSLDLRTYFSYEACGWERCF
jgi:hypothetical protein